LKKQDGRKTGTLDPSTHQPEQPSVAREPPGQALARALPLVKPAQMFKPVDFMVLWGNS